MLKQTLTYGATAGFIIILVNTLSLELGFGHVWLGFLVMFLAFGLIFVAIARHRDAVLGGAIEFSTALWIGLGVTLVATFVYVAVWELYLWLNDYSFIEQYTSDLVRAAITAGAEPEALEELLQANDRLKEQYANPVARIPMTAVEIAPVGVLVSLVAATVMRRRSVLQE